MSVLGQAVELEVLTLELDHAMVRALGAVQVTDALYAAAYRTVDNRAARLRQIDLIVGIGTDLDRIVSRAWLGALLHAAHVPAHAAGFGELQDFLERGYAAFRRMRGARACCAPSASAKHFSCRPCSSPPSTRSRAPVERSA